MYSEKMKCSVKDHRKQTHADTLACLCGTFHLSKSINTKHFQFILYVHYSQPKPNQKLRDLLKQKVILVGLFILHNACQQWIDARLTWPFPCCVKMIKEWAYCDLTFEPACSLLIVSSHLKSLASADVLEYIRFSLDHFHLSVFNALWQSLLRYMNFIWIA